MFIEPKMTIKWMIVMMSPDQLGIMRGNPGIA